MAKGTRAKVKTDITIADVMDMNRKLYRALSQEEADPREEGIAEWFTFMKRYSTDVLDEDWDKLPGRILKFREINQLRQVPTNEWPEDFLKEHGIDPYYG